MDGYRPEPIDRFLPRVESGELLLREMQVADVLQPDSLYLARREPELESVADPRFDHPAAQFLFAAPYDDLFALDLGNLRGDQQFALGGEALLGQLTTPPTDDLAG